MHVPVLALAELLVALAALVLTFAVAWRISRGGGGAAVSELSEANRVLEKRLHDLREEHKQKLDELGGQVRDLQVENAALKARTDYEAVIAKHEERAQARHEAQLHVLELIAARLTPLLGPDPTE